MLTPEEQTELQRLLREHIPLRAIARRLNRDVKTIRRALGRSRSPRPPAPAPSKLAPYHALITERFQQGPALPADPARDPGARVHGRRDASSRPSSRP